MKRMKIMMIAMMAIVMGVSFTSCLDSDSGPEAFPEMVNIVDFMGIPTVTSDAGYQLDVQNISNMKANDGSYPKRAMVWFEKVEGEIYDSGKSSYKVVFRSYSYVLNIGNVSYDQEIESVTPINSFIYYDGQQQTQIVFGSGKYLNFCMNVTIDDDTNFENDFVLNPSKVENGVLYCNVLHTKEVSDKDNESGYLYMSYILPSKGVLQERFPDLTFTGEDNNIIEVVLVAEGKNEQEIKTEKVKVVIPNSIYN